MLSNPFSRPTRTIFVIVILLLAGMLYYRPAHDMPHNFPRLDSETFHYHLNRSDHAQIPLGFMSRLQKKLHHTKCTTPGTRVQHHYRTETKTSTKTMPVTTTTAFIQPTCDAFIDAVKVSKEGFTPEQLTIAKLRDEGIVIIFKTGAQDSARLAIQVGTTLRYMSANDILFFSDQQGSLGPFLINDALRNVAQEIKDNESDFKIYREIRQYQSTGRDIMDLADDAKADERSGWKLDKYKFIHMVEETFQMRPNAKWYVFVETDSYVFWDNLAEWLKGLDSTKPWYLGSRVVSGKIEFAHGGSGYILSNAAMNKLLGPEAQGLAESWDEKMKKVQYGDMALAMALKEKGVSLSVAHPLLNGYKPSTFTYGPGNHWCQPVVTMHHVTPSEVSSTWRYERQRELLDMPNNTLFADLYMHFVEPHLVDSRDNWDNLSHGPTYSQELVDEAKKVKEGEKKKAEGNAKKTEASKGKDVDNVKQVESGVRKGPVNKTQDGMSGKNLEFGEIAGGKENEKNGATKEEMKAEKKDEKKGERKESGKGDREKDGKTADATQAAGNSKTRPGTGSRTEGSESEKDRNSAKKPEAEELKEEKDEEPTVDEKEDHQHSDGILGTGSPTEATQSDINSPQRAGVVKRAAPDLKDAQSHAHESFEKCGQLCEKTESCFQWVYYSKTCKLGMSFRLGQYVKPSDDGKAVWKSGWLLKRVRKWTEGNVCKHTEWLKL